MANKITYKKIKFDFVEENYPVLFNTIEGIGELSKEQKEKIAGLCVEILIQSGGPIELFSDELSELEIDDEFYDV